MKQPLRKIVEWFTNEHGTPCERLECGHVVHERQDIIGPTNANRRRCRKCPPILTLIEQAHEDARRSYMEKRRRERQIADSPSRTQE